MRLQKEKGYIFENKKLKTSDNTRYLTNKRLKTEHRRRHRNKLYRAKTEKMKIQNPRKL